MYFNSSLRFLNSLLLENYSFHRYIFCINNPHCTYFDHLQESRSSSNLYILFPGYSVVQHLSQINNDLNSDLWVQGTSIALPFLRPINSFFLERLGTDRLSIALLHYLMTRAYSTSINTIVLSSLSLSSNWDKQLFASLPSTATICPTISPVLSSFLHPSFAVSDNLNLFYKYSNTSIMPKLYSSVVCYLF